MANKAAYPGTTRNLLQDDRLILNTNSDLISEKNKRTSSRADSNRSSTESLKESLPKISQLSKHQKDGGSTLRNNTTSGLTSGSDMSKKPAVVRRMGEQLLR